VLWARHPSSVLALKYLVGSIGITATLLWVRYGLYGHTQPPQVVDQALLFIIGVPYGRWLWELLVLRCKKYSVTETRLAITRGVFNRVSDEVELFRVRDFQLQQPLVQRIFGLSTLIVVTSDRTCPVVAVTAIPDGEDLRDLLRVLVRQCWDSRGVRE